MTMVVGLTGGVGSGKSTATQVFIELGVPVIDADQIARELASPQQPAYERIVKRFGKVVLQPDGQLNRYWLREVIFSQGAQKKWLEALLHPLIHDRIVEKVRYLNDLYCIVVIPLLVEHFDQYKDVIQHVVVIDTSPEQQLKWATTRDNMPEELARKIIQSQATSEQRLAIANTVIRNDGSMERFQQKVKELHSRLAQLFKAG